MESLWINIRVCHLILFTAMNFYIELSMQSCTQNSAALLVTNISMTLWIFHVICTAFPHI